VIITYPAYLREPLARWGVRVRLSRLRRIGPQPFGLTADPGRPPLMLGDESSSTSMITETRAALTGSRVPLDRLSLLYGNYFDLSAPLVEVTTHWDGRGWLTHLPRGYPEGAWELGRAERRDAALASGNLKAMHSSERHPALGPFTRGTTEVVVGGDASQVATLSYREHTALSFTAQGLTVTVVSRHPLPPSPRFDLVTDLEPFFEGYVRGTQEWLRRLYREPAAADPR
jgi:hypothetical protein